MNKYLLSLVVFSFVVLSLSLTVAVECNADLSQGGNSCTVSSSLTLNGSYVVNMNGSNNGAIISISADNVVFDCNGTQIYGNKTIGNLGTNARGIQKSFRGTIDLNNIRKNIDFKGFLIGIMTIMFTFLLLVTIAFIFNGFVCSALGG